ncbi:MAG: hypothetical protein ACYTBZ_07560 [Planctomycetota bacterium]
MNNPITKYAAAAVIIIAAVALSTTFLSKAATSAYAIEQTIQANHSVRFLHIKTFIAKESAEQMVIMMVEQMQGADAAKNPQIQQLAAKAVQAAKSKDEPLEPIEFWTEFEHTGQLKNLRLIKPAWLWEPDGKIVAVWKDNKAKAWLEKKNLLFTAKDRTLADHIRQSVESADPKLAMAKLQNQKAQGKVNLHIDQPPDKTKPVVVTATFTDESEPFHRQVLFVDQATKLVNSTECYQLRDGEYHKMLTAKYYDYNQPIAPEMFTLTDIPDDAIVIDQTTQDVGLVQGDLTDQEIAVKVTRQFIEALMKKDYAKAGRLFEGTPAESIKKVYGKIKFVRIVSISKSDTSPFGGGFFVSHKIEIEKDGKVVIWKANPAHVRQVHGQPQRWTIAGGFLGI